MRKTYFTYIMSNTSCRVYVGSTSELQVRACKPGKAGTKDPCTKETDQRLAAREEVATGAAANPDWVDLSAEWKEDESWQAIPEAKPSDVAPTPSETMSAAGTIWKWVQTRDFL
jgi:predicted GIY-YIG superfamily endonuclease